MQRFVSVRFPLILSSLQWFFCCMTEIGVNHQPGWAERVVRAVIGMGAKVSLLSFISPSPSSSIGIPISLPVLSFQRVQTNYSSSFAAFWKPMTTGLMK